LVKETADPVTLIPQVPVAFVPEVPAAPMVLKEIVFGEAPSKTVPEASPDPVLLNVREELS
jgi:hypothetical protein